MLFRQAQQIGRADPVRANRLIGELLAADPDDAEAIAFQGTVWLNLGRPDAALTRFDRALALQPGMLAALNTRAAILLILGRLEAALADYDRILDLEPQNADA